MIESVFRSKTDFHGNNRIRQKTLSEILKTTGLARKKKKLNVGRPYDRVNLRESKFVFGWTPIQLAVGEILQQFAIFLQHNPSSEFTISVNC